jgi:hypothetical protein
MPAAELATRKKALAAELNGYIAMKKEFMEQEGARGDLVGGQGTEVEMALEGERTKARGSVCTLCTVRQQLTCSAALTVADDGFASCNRHEHEAAHGSRPQGNCGD